MNSLKVKTTRINPVTRKHEPYLSPWDKAARVLFTNSFVFVMVSIRKPKTSIFVLSHHYNGKTNVLGISSTDLVVTNH